MYKITTSEAKNIPLESYLQTLGFYPVSSLKGGIELWFKSPFRNDKTASFKVDTSKNTWYDFGIGNGGSIIDFVMTNQRCNVSAAFDILAKTEISKEKLRFSPTTPQKSKKVALKSVKKLNNFPLICYALERNISIDTAKKYLAEIHYSPINKDSEYFALGFKNLSGGYEVRNKYFKGSVGEKNISFLKGKDSTRVSIFEGFFDFLSVLQDKKILELKTDVIVLNSVTQLSKSIEFVKQNEYQKIFSFMDNDSAGETATISLSENLEIDVLDMRYLYKDYKDYNDKLSRRKVAIS